MCGIAGFLGSNQLTPERIEGTLDVMRRRGPDHQAFQFYRLGDQSLTLLHSRLSIIDLDARSHQPFTRGHCSIVFNGEIYNYLEIREELTQRGHCFLTNSDTEVLLAAYQEYGPGCVDKFEGMWAFALLDESNGSLFLSRDRFAEKPLYLMRRPEGLYFASEIKALRTMVAEKLAPNTDQLLRYLMYGYKVLHKGSQGFYRGVEELPYASWVSVTAHDQIKIEQFWKPKFTPRTISRHDAIEGIRQHLFNSMRLRLRSDVPLAFCLSGGIDSGSLASIAAKQFGAQVHCYSILDSDPRYDERANIRATVENIGATATEIVLTPNRTLDRLKQVIDYHDGPIATITYYIHSLLSERISADGYKVVFSGTAADELFTGYYDHFNLFLYEMRDTPDFDRHLQDWLTHIQPIVRNPILQNPRMYIDNPHERGHITLNSEEFRSYLRKDFSEQFSEERFTDSLLRNRMLNEIFHEASRLILHEDDLNSMMFSLENRSPFLDRGLFEFAYSLPSHHLIKDGYGKSLLREAMQGILNDKVRLDRQKKGFNAGIKSVFDLSDGELRSVVLDDGPIYHLLRKSEIERVMDTPELSNSFSKFLFSFINARLFLDGVAR
jgi:asparagine synthase (glutamine-hydrolysing)